MNGFEGEGHFNIFRAITSDPALLRKFEVYEQWRDSPGDDLQAFYEAIGYRFQRKDPNLFRVQYEEETPREHTFFAQWIHRDENTTYNTVISGNRKTSSSSRATALFSQRIHNSDAYRPNSAHDAIIDRGYQYEKISYFDRREENKERVQLKIGVGERYPLAQVFYDAEGNLTLCSIDMGSYYYLQDSGYRIPVEPSIESWANDIDFFEPHHVGVITGVATRGGRRMDVIPTKAGFRFQASIDGSSAKGVAVRALPEMTTKIFPNLVKGNIAEHKIHQVNAIQDGDSLVVQSGYNTRDRDPFEYGIRVPMRCDIDAFRKLPYRAEDKSWKDAAKIIPATLSIPPIGLHVQNG